MAEFVVEGVLLVGHIVRIYSETRQEVPGVIREAKQFGRKTEVVVEMVTEWRMTPRLPDRS
jgi:hypothetical protein